MYDWGNWRFMVAFTAMENARKGTSGKSVALVEFKVPGGTVHYLRQAV